MLLAGLSCLLFAVVYAILPMLTKLELRSQRLVDLHFWLWMPGTILMTMVMSRAGSLGMLRRTIYENGEFSAYSGVAIIGTLFVAAGLVVFLVNIIWTIGLVNVLSLFLPEQWLTRGKRTATAEA
jgi:cytochrome c oxidase subunit 1